MKLLLRIVIISILAYSLPYYLPWWSLAIVSALVGFMIPGSGLNAFISGFLGGGVVWLFLSWQSDAATASIMSEKIVQLFPFKDATYLIILSGIIGAIVAGLSCLTGASFRDLFIKKKKRSFYN